MLVQGFETKPPERPSRPLSAMDSAPSGLNYSTHTHQQLSQAPQSAGQVPRDPQAGLSLPTTVLPFQSPTAYQLAAYSHPSKIATQLASDPTPAMAGDPHRAPNVPKIIDPAQSSSQRMKPVSGASSNQLSVPQESRQPPSSPKPSQPQPPSQFDRTAGQLPRTSQPPDQVARLSRSSMPSPPSQGPYLHQPIFGNSAGNTAENALSALPGAYKSDKRPQLASLSPSTPHCLPKQGYSPSDTGNTSKQDGKRTQPVIQGPPSAIHNPNLTTRPPPNQTMILPQPQARKPWQDLSQAPPATRLATPQVSRIAQIQSGPSGNQESRKMFKSPLNTWQMAPGSTQPPQGGPAAGTTIANSSLADSTHTASSARPPNIREAVHPKPPPNQSLPPHGTPPMQCQNDQASGQRPMYSVVPTPGAAIESAALSSNRSNARGHGKLPCPDLGAGVAPVRPSNVTTGPQRPLPPVEGRHAGSGFSLQRAREFEETEVTSPDKDPQSHYVS